MRDYQKIIELAGELRFRTGSYGPLPGTEDYTGIGNSIGQSGQHNSPFSANQFLLALALSQHPSVFQMVEGEGIDEINLDLNALAGKKVLHGLKMLDLGCGVTPAFARVSRTLGAEIYTADILPVDRLKLPFCELSHEDIDLENQYHIEGDLRSEDALAKIISLSGGDFDLVTEAHITSGMNWNGEDLKFFGARDFSEPLLKEGGIFYRGEDCLAEENPFYVNCGGQLSRDYGL